MSLNFKPKILPNRDKTFFITTVPFSIPSSSYRGYHSLGESRRSKSYLFKLPRRNNRSPVQHFKLHTNDVSFSKQTNIEKSTSSSLNRKYTIGRLLSFFLRDKK